MSGYKLIGIYSARMVLRQWRRFVLPFFSLAITAVVLTLTLLITEGSTLYLTQQSRTLLGGDIVLESTSPIDTTAFWERARITPTKQSDQLSFSGTLQSGSTTAPFSLQVVDARYPLYGTLVLRTGAFIGVADNEVYLDEAGAKKLQVDVGDQVSFGTREFIVGGIIVSDPTSLFGAFRFLPRALLSQEGFAMSGVDSRLLRATYSSAALFNNVSAGTLEQVRIANESFAQPLEVKVAGQDQRGLLFGLQAVSSFLSIVVLITAVLAAVNVYASTLYLVRAERRNLAVLLALGLRRRWLIYLLGSALGYIVVCSCVCGIVLGDIAYLALSSSIASAFAITLPLPNVAFYGLVCIALIVAIASASFIPAVTKTFSLSPKRVLTGDEEDQDKKPNVRFVVGISLATLVPLTVFASFLLGSLRAGVLSILAIGVTYSVIAWAFSTILAFLYARRARYPFFVRSIISQKKVDGIFGIVSFTSLFIALVAIGSLALTQLSLERYLVRDLARSAPTTYVLDIQPSQKDALLQQFPDLTLYANVRARIIAIDSLRVQDELAKETTSVDRELGREYNLTARTGLEANEVVTKGTWSEGKAGEISVDEAFAKRARISLGSRIVFSIQGFEVAGSVTSLRKTDARSGLPFFYFVLSPSDIGAFPAVYFGYSYASPTSQKLLSEFVATSMPNISVLETQSIGPQIIAFVQTLLLLVLIVTFPPLLIAMLLITTLIVSSYESRRREGARLRAIGATRLSVLIYYLIETLSLTFVAVLIAYVLSGVVAFGITTYFLKVGSTVFFDTEILLGCGLLVGCVGLIGLYLFRRDTMPLRELLSYESNI